MNKKDVLKLVLIGALGGFANGFLGSGGGIIMLIGLYSVIDDTKKAHASCILAIAPLSVISMIIYFQKGIENTEIILPLLLGAGAGGLLGALFLAKLKPKVVELIFAGIMIFSGVRCFL